MWNVMMHKDDYHKLLSLQEAWILLLVFLRQCPAKQENKNMFKLKQQRINNHNSVAKLFMDSADGL